MSATYAIDANLDRISFSTFVAVVAHLFVLFAVGFALEDPTAALPRLEITLSHFASDKAPDEADFLAQHNQQGSGTLDEKRELSTTEMAPYEDIVVREVSQSRPQQHTAELAPQTRVSQQDNASRPTSSPSAEPVPEQVPSLMDGAANADSQEIASLEAKLDRQQQAYAKRPRIHRITSVSTRRSDDAQYQFAWQQKVEYVGNENYPDEARARSVEGDVRLMVALLPDGKVKRIEVLASSGSSLLDQAAIRSVRLAAPFDPFPPSIREKADILEIIRTWQFRHDRLTSRG